MKTISLKLMMFLSFCLTALAVADDAVVPAGSTVAQAATGTTPPPVGMAGQLVPIVAMFAVLYFLMIRPQQKKMKEHQALVNGLKAGDEVVTSAGILGKIDGVAEKFVTLEVASNVKIKVLKSQVSQVVKN